MPQPAGGRQVRRGAVRGGPVRRAPAHHGARRRPRLRKRRVMRVAGAVSLAVLTTSGLANVAMDGIGKGIGRVDAFSGLDNRPSRGAGQNFLLVGTDGRDRITPQERELYHLGGAPCHCTDTIMLAHLSADRTRLSVVSVPRDSYTRLPASNGRGTRPAKVNAAYPAGGPSLMVRTVERMTGVHLDHYLELDFTSFMKTVDAVGGVPVCTARPLYDPKSGLDLPAGTTLLNGGRALEYVRARYLDGSADFGRMQRQQRFVAELIHRATGTGVLLDPGRLGDTVGSALGSIRADKDLRPADLVDLATAMRNFSPKSAEFASVPVRETNHKVRGVGTTVTWDPVRAARLFSAIRADRPLISAGTAASHRQAAAHRPRAIPVEVDPARVRVAVSGPDPAAVWRTAAELRATGFAVERTSTEAAGHAAAGSPGAGRANAGGQAVISYDPRWNRSIRSLSAAVPSARVRPAPGSGGVLRVALGSGRAAVAPVRPAGPAPAPDPRTGVAAVTGEEELCR